MEKKVALEGSTALLSLCSQLVDQRLISGDPQAPQRLTLLLELLTPIAKSWPWEYTPRRTNMRFRFWVAMVIPASTRWSGCIETTA